MHDHELLEYYKAGWIPAPGETASDFSARIAALKTLKEVLEQGGTQEFPFSLNKSFSNPSRKEIEEATRAFYGTVLFDCFIFCSNKKLLPWQGAITWIFQVEGQGVAPVIQLHRCFATQKYLFGLYDCHELLMHELAHAGRVAFHEPQFEETIAYASSKSYFRRLFGPLFSATWEASLFIFTLLLTVLAQVAAIFWHPISFVPLALLLFSFLGLGFLFARAGMKYFSFSRAHANLEGALQDKAWHILYLLSDHQIYQLAKQPDFLKELKATKANASLHDRLIALLIDKLTPLAFRSKIES